MADEEKTLSKEERIKRGKWLTQQSNAMSLELLLLLERRQQVPPWGKASGGSGGLTVLTMAVMLGRYLGRNGKDPSEDPGKTVDRIWESMRELVIEAVVAERLGLSGVPE